MINWKYRLVDIQNNKVIGYPCCLKEARRMAISYYIRTGIKEPIQLDKAVAYGPNGERQYTTVSNFKI